MDLKTFFDEVEHMLLLQILYRQVKCHQTLRLIRKWLRAPIEINGKLVKRRKGMPQGSPLSPLLSNLLLDDLDKELKRMNVKYIRYADDFSIYCQEANQAQEVQRSVCVFLEKKLHLPINEEKSGIRRPEDFTLLGYGFGKPLKGDETDEYYPKVKKKSWTNLKQKQKEATRKTRPYSFDMRMAKLKEIQRGWIEYFKFAVMSQQLKDLDSWVRSRLRYCIWHHWKKPERRCKSLIRMGVNPIKARKWSYTRIGGWATARSPILKTTITISRLKRRGYESMYSIYESITPYLNEPLYTRPVRTVV
jgi:Retron-type reverse transcriptase